MASGTGDFLLEENVNLAPTTEEDEFHLGMSSREEVAKGRESLQQARHTRAEGCPFWPGLCTGAAKHRAREAWFCTDSSDTWIRF